MKIWEAIFLSDPFESAWVTLSVHRSPEGAQKAIELHQMEIEDRWKKGDWLTDPEDSQWLIHETELKD